MKLKISVLTQSKVLVFQDSVIGLRIELFTKWLSAIRGYNNAVLCKICLYKKAMLFGTAGNKLDQKNLSHCQMQPSIYISRKHYS